MPSSGSAAKTGSAASPTIKRRFGRRYFSVANRTDFGIDVDADHLDFGVEKRKLVGAGA